jgi:transcriptional regulator with XRE-family HTH domain
MASHHQDDHWFYDKLNDDLVDAKSMRRGTGPTIAVSPWPLIIKRAELGWTQEQTAQLAGLGLATLRRMERTGIGRMSSVLSWHAALDLFLNLDTGQRSGRHPSTIKYEVRPDRDVAEFEAKQHRSQLTTFGTDKRPKDNSTHKKTIHRTEEMTGEIDE